MSLRRLWVLVSRLPPDSATFLLMSGFPGEGPERRMWRLPEHLLAQIFDALALLNHNFVAANNSKRTAMKEPEPFPRPGLPDKPKRRR